jgi:hypothetical protein
MKRWLALLLLAAGSAHAATTVPASPSAARAFMIRTTGIGCGVFTNQRSEVAGSVITLAYEEQDACFQPQPPGATDLSVIAQVPTPGTYEIRLRSENKGRVTGLRTTAESVTVAGGDFTGLWYDPAQPGWGLHVVRGQNVNLFATWFTYNAAASSNPLARVEGAWYFASGGQFVSPTEFRGQLNLARSGTSIVPVGTLTLRLVAEGQLQMQVGGAPFPSTPFSLRRLEF